MTPWTKSILDAPIKRVLIASSIPNTLVSGKSVKLILSGLMEFQYGSCEQEAKQLIRAFSHNTTNTFCHDKTYTLVNYYLPPFARRDSVMD